MNSASNPKLYTYTACLDCRKVNRVPVTIPKGHPFAGPGASNSQSGAGNAKKPVCGGCKSELSVRGAVSALGASALLSLIEKSPLPVVACFAPLADARAKSFVPIFERVAEYLAGAVVFVEVDLLLFPLATDTYGIHSVPTLIYFSGGFERSRQAGPIPPDALMAWLEALISTSEQQTAS